MDFRQEELRRALNGDASAITDILCDCYGEKFEDVYDEDSPQERMNIVFDYLYARLKEIADRHAIPVETLGLVAKLQSVHDDIEPQLESGDRSDEAYFRKLQDRLYSATEDARLFRADCIAMDFELQDILENPDLLSDEQRLVAMHGEDLKSEEFLKPQMIIPFDEDGWLDLDAGERLETEEERQKRVEETLRWYEEQLAAAREKDKKVGDRIQVFKKWWNFVNNLKPICAIDVKNIQLRHIAYEKAEKAKLSNFEADEKFFADVLRIMEHDNKKECFWYHGTQDVESAYSILKQGLGLASRELSSTAYREFTPEQMLLYHRGFAGEIGEDAIIVFRQPIDESGRFLDIIKKNDQDIEFCSSGLGFFSEKLEYIIPQQYIVGIVNKRDHKVVFARDLKKETIKDNQRS